MQHADTRIRECFTSSNYWGIPDLLPDMCADVVPGENCEFMVYRTKRLTPSETAGDILGWFVDDYRFKCCWSYPHRMVATLASYSLAAVCEPNFSLWLDRPRTEQMHATYQTRWCGRFWQEHGFKVIPSLNWSDEESYRWAWLGIPVDIPVAAVECRSCGDNHDGFNLGLAQACNAVRPKKLIIYGPGKGWVQVPAGVEPCWVSPVTNQRLAKVMADYNARNPPRRKTRNSNHLKPTAQMIASANTPAETV